MRLQFTTHPCCMHVPARSGSITCVQCSMHASTQMNPGAHMPACLCQSTQACTCTCTQKTRAQSILPDLGLNRAPMKGMCLLVNPCQHSSIHQSAAWYATCNQRMLADASVSSAAVHKCGISACMHACIKICMCIKSCVCIGPCHMLQYSGHARGRARHAYG